MRIKHRLYREHTIISPEERIKLMNTAVDTGTIHGNNLPIILKDLSKIGRSLEKTILVDNIADNFHL
jgi:DNA-directed RNA polymerase subunit H (RpoH/RPB5)